MNDSWVFHDTQGAANAGVPLSLLVQQYGWNAFFAALLLACAAAIVLLAPITGAQSHVQRSMNQWGEITILEEPKCPSRTNSTKCKTFILYLHSVYFFAYMATA